MIHPSLIHLIIADLTKTQHAQADENHNGCAKSQCNFELKLHRLRVIDYRNSLVPTKFVVHSRPTCIAQLLSV